MVKKIAIAIFVLAQFACNTWSAEAQDRCGERAGLQIDHKLIDTVKIAGKDYCEVLIAAFEGNEKDIVLLTTYNSKEGIYQHGAVLIALIEKTGDERYTKIISTLPAKEKISLYHKISAGSAVYPDTKYKTQSFEVSFPYLAEELKKRESRLIN